MDSLNFAVFAHNEERNITRCLESICQSTSESDLLNVSVLVNGSSDATLELVTSFCKNHSGFKIIEIELGDKSNAWNQYIYNEAQTDSPHYFLDGDNWLPALSMDYITRHWDHSHSTALAALPIGVSESLRNMLRDHCWISGNFYGLSGQFISKIKTQCIRIPIGFIGEDSLITYLLETQFDRGGPQLTSEDRLQLVTVLEFTGPVIPRVPMTLDMVRMLHNRYKRYAVRHFQQEVFYYLARHNRLDELPTHASKLKYHLKDIGIRPYTTIAGLQTIYHPYAIIKMLLAR